jgi:hypothetical protein
LYSLFIESSILSFDMAFRKTEFLSEAAYAIVSSLADRNLGTPLAVQLLLPYAVREGTIEIVSAIADLVERYVPGSDAEAIEIMSLCRPLVDMKSIQVLDACSSIALCRYRQHSAKEQVRDAVHWLIAGIDLEDKLLPLLDQGSCFRAMLVECFKATKKLVEALANSHGDEEPEEPTAEHAFAEALAEEFEGHNYSVVPEAQVLKAVLALYNAIIMKQSSDGQLSTLFIACFESRDFEGVRSQQARPPFHKDLLQIAQNMLALEQDDLGHTEGDDVVETQLSTFGKDGVVTVMERLVQLSAQADILPTELLVNACARSIRAENAKKKTVQAPERWREIYKMRSCNIEMETMADQESLVQHMLDY